MTGNKQAAQHAFLLTSARTAGSDQRTFPARRSKDANMKLQKNIHWRRIILSACRLKRILRAGSRQDQRRFTGGCRRVIYAILHGAEQFGPYFVIAPGLARCRMAARKKGQLFRFFAGDPESRWSSNHYLHK